MTNLLVKNEHFTADNLNKHHTLKNTLSKTSLQPHTVHPLAVPRKTVHLVGGRGQSAMATGQQIVGEHMCTVRMRLLSAAVLRPDLRTLNPKP